MAQLWRSGRGMRDNTPNLMEHMGAQLLHDIIHVDTQHDEKEHHHHHKHTICWEIIADADLHPDLDTAYYFSQGIPRGLNHKQRNGNAHTTLLLYKSSISIKTNTNKMIEALGHNQIWLDPQLSKAKLIFSTLTKPLSHGKIGIWPVGHYKAAQHESKNQPKGTPVWKNETIGKAEYWELLIDCVLPAVLERFPTAYFNCHGLCIQHDGAKSHIPPDNTD